MVRYIVSVGEEELEELFQIVATELDEEAREVVMTTAEKLRAEGALRARREMLIRQVEARFGELSGETRRRIEKANLAELDRWGVNFANATTLAEVFADPR